VIDYDRTTPNFTANLEDASAPTSYTANPVIGTIGVMTLPRPGDVATIEGGVPTYYINATSISLNGGPGSHLIIEAGKNVAILLSSTATSISVGGNGGIELQAAATLNIYTAGNVAIAGNGILNNDPVNKPQNFMLWGTRASTAASLRNISIAGNGELNAVVYAPNANVTAKGGGSSGSVGGAIVGNTVTITGGSAFHYDQALAELNADQPFGISIWNELTSAASRAGVASKFTY
jgi:hypothetical protein